MNLVEKNSINALAEAIKSAEGNQDDNEIGGSTAADLINALLSEPDKKVRSKMIKEFSERHEDVAKFLADHADLINAEAEAALIGAAVGGTHTEKEVSYRGGRKSVKTKRVKALPNVTALQFLLKNRLPGKYSDKPVGDVEIEDVSGIEEALYGNNS